MVEEQKIGAGNTIPEDRDRLIALEKLRAEIWKHALIAENETTLVQNLLNKAGPVLGCESIAFMPYSENLKEIVVELQWRADGEDTGLGEVVPTWIFKRSIGQPHMQVSYNKLPLWLKPIVKPFQKKYNPQSTLIIPYGDPHDPEGYICVNNYTYAKEYSDKEIDFFIELSKIIHLRSKQLQSQTALQASETRYRQIFETNQVVKLIINPVDGQIVEANQAAARFYGYDYATLTQMRITDINTLSEAEVKQEMERARREERLFFNFRHRLASGEIRDVEVYSGPVETEKGALLYSIIHDVPERKQAEEKLRQLSRTVEQSGNTIVITDLKGIIEFVNPAFVEIIDYDPKEAIGQNPRIPQSGKTPPKDFGDMWKTLTDGQVWQGEFVNKKKNGELYQESVVISPIKDEAGQIAHYVAVKEDITQRKQAEAIMHARLHLVDFAVSHSLEALLKATLDKTEALTNSTIGFYHILEADQKTLWLQTWSTNTRQNMCTAEGHARHYSIDNAGVWADCIRERRPIIHNDYPTLPHRKGMPDGHIPVIRELAVPVLRGNKIVAVLGVGNKPSPYNANDIETVSQLADLAWDIVERKRAEEALRKSREQYHSVITNVKEVIFQTDTEGMWTFLNPAWTEVTGFPLEESIGTNLLNYVYPDDRQSGIDLFQPLFNKEKVDCRHEIRYLTRSGGFRWVEIYARLILNEMGRPVGTTGTLMDITERKQAEASLLKSNSRLESALTELKETQEKMMRQERLAAVGQLSAGIAHDFNNILTSILGYTELMQLSPDISASMQSNLEKIAASGQRATHLVRQLLDFSRKSVRQLKQFEMDTFVTEMVGFLERTIPEHIQISLKIAPDNYPIEADSNQLQQVITNLAVNARDAMPSGGKLTISLSQVEVAGNEECTICSQPITGAWITITVADTGRGIPADILPRIFEPFFTTKEVGEGTGLGLSQVYGIVNQHAGHITVNSQIDQGTMITIYLPPLVKRTEKPVVESPPMMLSGLEETILLVEDEPVVLEATKAMLEHLNYQVITAKNGQEALAVYQTHQAGIALVLSDMIMPDMTGEALFHALKAKNPDLKMVMMSGYPLGKKGKELLERGLVAWFEKPISFGQLSQMISNALVEKKGRWD